jgi:hypothetical protein
MTTPTRLQRIADLFDHEWPSTRWKLNWHVTSHSAHLTITSQDRMTVFARVVFCPRMDLEGTRGVMGYQIDAGYPAFLGDPSEMEEPLAVITALRPVLLKMKTTALIREGV